MEIRDALFTASLVMLLTAGCETGNAAYDAHGIVGVNVNPDQQGLVEGSTLQFQAVVELVDGTNEDVTLDSSTIWSTSDADVATVTTTGIVTAVKPGVVEITADYKGETGSERFAVTP